MYSIVGKEGLNKMSVNDVSKRKRKLSHLTFRMHDVDVKCKWV